MMIGLPLKGLLVLTIIAAISVTLAKQFLGVEESDYQRGRKLFNENGCVACHSVNSSIKNWREGETTNLDEDIFQKTLTVEDIVFKIRYGDYDENFLVAQKIIPDTLKMPAYGYELSDEDMYRLASFILVTAEAIRSGELAKLGTADTNSGPSLAHKWGCFSCHGPLGQGGVANPNSLKGYIPGWFGEDFQALTDNGNREVVLEWILHGDSAAITEKSFGRGLVAKYLLANQLVKMPAFKGSISDNEASILTDYILAIAVYGDMGADTLQEYLSKYSGPLSLEEAAVENSTTVQCRAALPTEESGIAPTEKTEVDKLQTILLGCAGCHNSAEKQSGYNMSTRSSIIVPGDLAFGQGQSAVSVGNSEKSFLIEYLEQSSSDGHELSCDNVNTLKRWIDGGMIWPNI